MNLNRRQFLTLIAVTGLLFGLLIVPLLAQKFFGFNAVTIAFIVIAVYAALNYWLKNR